MRYCMVMRVRRNRYQVDFKLRARFGDANNNRATENERNSSQNETRQGSRTMLDALVPASEHIKANLTSDNIKQCITDAASILGVSIFGHRRADMLDFV